MGGGEVKQFYQEFNSLRKDQVEILELEITEINNLWYKFNNRLNNKR